ncbi:hypothetical protein [Cupriavidus sp. BIS7]|uniref:hypothetical protein n=1 Tax=Cupriavidus sp. BIS7 TaxID=1217718 RepID=UPI0012F66FDE|nr:hypothetical protein [Cupriavidus sp. BIS7]
MHFLSSLVISAHFSSPSLANSISEQIEINFLSEKNWIEINRIERTPEVLDIGLRHVNGKLTHIASFNQEGPAPAELVTVFKGSGKFRSDIFVVIKWYYNLPGVDTDGNFYEVHAYEEKKNNNQIKFSENKKISNIFGQGFDGRQEGKIVRFKYKDEPSIRGKLRQLNN